MQEERDIKNLYQLLQDNHVRLQACADEQQYNSLLLNTISNLANVCQKYPKNADLRDNFADALLRYAGELEPLMEVDPVEVAAQHLSESIDLAPDTNVSKYLLLATLLTPDAAFGLLDEGIPKVAAGTDPVDVRTDMCDLLEYLVENYSTLVTPKMMLVLGQAEATIGATHGPAVLEHPEYLICKASMLTQRAVGEDDATAAATMEQVRDLVHQSITGWAPAIDAEVESGIDAEAVVPSLRSRQTAAGMLMEAGEAGIAARILAFIVGLTEDEATTLDLMFMLATAFYDDGDHANARDVVQAMGEALVQAGPAVPDEIRASYQANMARIIAEIDAKEN